MKESLESLKSQVSPLLQKTWELAAPQDRKMAILNNLTTVERSLEDCLNQLRLAEADALKALASSERAKEAEAVLKEEAKAPRPGGDQSPVSLKNDQKPFKKE